MNKHMETYFKEAADILAKLDKKSIAPIVERLVRLKSEKGRLFLCGVGGSAANCSHAVNDFRKLAGIEAYAPTDNVSELTARTNDEGWQTIFSEWLKTSSANEKDVLMILSVGGGDLEKNISPNLVHAVNEAKKRKVDVVGVVGRDGGYTKKEGAFVVVVPTINPAHVTAHTESFQSVILHAMVSDPRLQINATKWESAGSPMR